MINWLAYFGFSGKSMESYLPPAQEGASSRLNVLTSGTLSEDHLKQLFDLFPGFEYSDLDWHTSKKWTLQFIICRKKIIFK